MSGTVDTKTVEMRFDNKNFESNVKQSMSTLDKLKQKLKLDGASKGLEEVEKKSKKLDFKDLDRSIDNIGRKFSALETIATGVFLRIGMKAADTGIKLLKSFTVDQVSSGWDRLEKKTTAVQVIMSSLKDDASKFTDEFSKMEYVEQWMEKLSWFADETSYSLPALTDGIGKLTSKGVGLESAVTAVEGMSLWAASAGQNAQTAARMYDQLSQAVGRGYMATQDWMSVESAQMDTAEFKELVIQLAEEANVIKKGEVTLENFRTTLNKKWLSSDIQIKAYEKYGEAVDYVVGKQRELEAAGIDKTANEIMQMIEKSTDEMDQAMANSLAFKAFKRGQEAKTFSEVLEATNTAVATGWMNIFETITGNYLEQRGIWTDLSNDLYHVFVDPLNNITEILELWNVGFSSGPLTELQKAFDQGSLENLDSGFKYVSRSAAEAAVESTKLGDDVYYTIEKLDDGSEQLVRKIKNVSGGYDRFVKKIYADDRELLSGRELLIEGFRNLLQTFLLDWEEEVGDEVVEHLSVLGALKKAFLEVFFPDIANDPEGGKKSIAEHLVDLTKKFKEFTEKLKPLGDKLKNIFKGFFTVINIIRKFISALLKPFKELFGTLFGGIPDGILGFSDSIATWIQNFDKFLEENEVFQKISEGIKTALDKISEGLNWLSVQLTGLTLEELFSSIKANINEFFSGDNKIGEKIGKIREFFTNIINQIKEVETDELPEKLTPLQTFWLGFKKVATAIITFFRNAIDQIKEVEISEELPEKLTPLQAFWVGLKKIFTGLVKLVKVLAVPIAKVISFLGDVLLGLSEALSKKQDEGKLENTTSFLERVKGIFDDIIDLVQSIFSVLKTIAEGAGKIIGTIWNAIVNFVTTHDPVTVIKTIIGVALGIAIIWRIFRSIQMSRSIAYVLEGVGDIFWRFEQRLGVRNWKNIARTVRIFAESLVLVAAAFAIFGKIKFNDSASVWEIAAIFAAFLALTGGIIFAARYAFKDFKDIKIIKTIARSMLVVALALVAVAGAFWIMGQIDFGEGTSKMWEIAAVFGLFLAIVAGLALIGTLLIKDIKGIFGIVSMMALIIAAAVSLGIVALSIALISKTVSAEEMNRALEIIIILGTIVGVLAAIGLIAGMIGVWGIVGLAAMAGLILTAGAACLIAGIGITIAAKALNELFKTVSSHGSSFSKKIKEISDAMLQIIRDVADNAKSIAILAGMIALIGIACLIAAPGLILVTLLIGTFVKLIDGVKDLIDAIVRLLDTLSEKDPEDINHLKKTFDAVLDSIIELAPKAERAATAIITAIANAIKAGARPIAQAGVSVILLTIIGILLALGTFADPIVEAFISFINKLADSMREHSDELAEAGVSLGEAFVEGILSGIEKKAAFLGLDRVVEWAQGAKEKLRGMLGRMRGESSNDVETPDIDEVRAEKFATKGNSRSSQAAANAGKADGESYVSGFTEATEESTSEFNPLQTFLGDSGIKMEDVKSWFSASGSDSGLAFGDGFSTALSNLFGGEDFSADNFNMEALTSLFNSSGSDSANEYITSFTSGVSDPASLEVALSASEEVASSAGEPLKSLSEESNTWGMDMVKNYADGMIANTGLPEDAAISIGKVIRGILGFSEPKKGPLSDFHTYAPDMIKLWCSGIYDNLGLIDDSSVAMGNRINDGFGTALDYVSNLIDGGMTDELTIRPIMDLSEIQNGVNKLDSMLSSDGYSLSGTADISSYAARDMSTFGVKNEPTQPTQPVSSNDTFNNTFNITNSDPDAVADRVSRILQQQVVRKQAVWAR